MHLSCRVYWRVNGSVVLIKITFLFRSAGASGGIRCVTSPGLRTASGASWPVLYSALCLQHREWGNPESTEIVTGNLPNPRSFLPLGAQSLYRLVELGIFVRFFEEHFTCRDLHLGQFCHLKEEKGNDGGNK